VHNAAGARRRLRILIADDERDTVLTLMMLLREEGHEVRGVYDGRQVLEILRDLRAAATDRRRPGDRRRLHSEEQRFLLISWPSCDP